MNVKYKADHSLVHEYLTGNKDAGHELYMKVMPYVEKFVFKQTEGSQLSREEQEDIIMDALQMSIQKLDTYTGECTFSTFVCGYAKNKIKQAYAKHTKAKSTVSFEVIKEANNELEFGEVELYQPGVNPPNIIILKEQMAVLKQAFSLLTPEYQQIVQLRFYNKVSVKKIMEMTGKSEDSIDALYRRAMKKFRDNFIKIYEKTTD